MSALMRSRSTYFMTITLLLCNCAATHSNQRRVPDVADSVSQLKAGNKTRIDAVYGFNVGVDLP